MSIEGPSFIDPAEGQKVNEAEEINKSAESFLESSRTSHSLLEDWEEMRVDEEYCKELVESLGACFDAYLPMISLAMSGVSRLKIGNELFSALAYELFNETKLGDNAHMVQGVIDYLGQNPNRGTSIDGEQIIIIREFFEESREFAEDILELLKGQE